MTEEEKEKLLAKARRDYPKGTIHGGYGNYKEKFITNGDLYIGINNNIYSIGQMGCIYHRNSKTWAKIISYPEGYKQIKYYFY